MPNSRYPWRVFWALFLAGIVGAAAILPYVFEVFGGLGANSSTALAATPLMITMQMLNLGLIYGVATGIGLWIAPKAGFPVPSVSDPVTTPKRGNLAVALIAGVILGIFAIAVLDALLLPHLPQYPSERRVAIWKRLLLCLYSGINEELLVRLFLLSLVAWGLQKITRTAPRTSEPVFWTANVIVSLIFGVGYLPAAAAFAPLTLLTVTTIVGVKGISGLVFGRLFWTRGLLVAMLAHFIADLIIHLVGPIFAP